MKNIKLLGACVLLSAALFARGDNLTDKVCPFSGGISHLLVPTFPTVHLPNSALRFYPDRYGVPNERINAFPLNYPGHRQSPVFSLAPFSGEVKNTNISYRFDNEKASPYRYDVFLSDYEVELSLTPAEKSAIFKLKFEKEGRNGFAINSKRGKLSIDKDGAISGFDVYGHRNEKNGTFPITVYTYAIANKVPLSSSLSKDAKSAKFVYGNDVKDLEVSYAISYVSQEQAKKNFNKEIAGKKFADVEKNAKKVWNDTLGQIKIEGGTLEQQKMFYTSLYRCRERMVNISEDSKYFSGYDNKVHIDTTANFYNDDWSWDTYRNLHPLILILNPAMQREKVMSFIKMGEQAGRMPTFPQVFGDAHCMNGNHYASIVWDAYCKGLKGIDFEKAYKLCKHTILETTMIPWIVAPKQDLDEFYNKNGYFPGIKDDEAETNSLVNGFEKRQAVTVTLAQSYDDWCMAQLAKELGYNDDYNFFINRSYNYRNLFNKKTGFMAPKDKFGNWIEPFDPKFSSGVGARAYFAENNAWTYIWDVTHNTQDLINLFGSKEAFEKKLDQLYVESLGCTRYNWPSKMPDSTGMVGQFVMGNEPSLHIPYLYNYIGKPWKTQHVVRRLADMWFRSDYMGIPGDEDGGSMSSFYVFSALGFYPVTPGLPMYVIGSPFFKKAEIALANGKTFTIKANNYSPDHKYIQSAKLNGKPLNRSWFTHDELVNGGVLEFDMGLRPNKEWAASAEGVPPSFKMK